LNAPIKYDYEYKSDTDKLTYIKALKTAAEDTSATKDDVLFAAFADNYEKLGIPVDGIDSIGADASGKLAFVTILRDNVDYKTPPLANAELATIVDYNLDIIEQLIDASFDAEAAAKFVMIKTTGDTISWYDAFYTELDFDDEAVDTDKVTKYVKDVKGTADFADRLAKAQAPITIDEIREYVYESAVLAVIADETKTATEVETLVFEYDESGEYFDDVDTAAYNRLDGDIQAKVLDEFIHVSYEDCDAAVDALNELIDYDWSEGYGSGNGSSSSNKGGNRGTISLPNSLVAENNATDEEKGFTDLGGFEWAEEAIADLAQRGIVNGKADGIYAPNDNVTRAEFIKMVISAMGVELGGAENAFADVAQDAWYAPYVAAAYRNAIALGDEKGNFYPEAPITREDMVTILYRVVDAEEGVGRVEKFTDAAQISDYAKAAVGYFGSKNIVTGMGDGSFAPKNNATRAETAVIIYRIITTLK
ncbi:MAG: S-layer homology domain-containing protein, partial [Clostridia bacterium]|nr:S-layer homology domain-containing protein [Clostridia bacterium]